MKTSPATKTPPATAAAMKPSIETAIEQVERLYQTVTGAPAPEGKGPYSPIPPEVDPQKYVEEKIAQLALAVSEAAGGPAASAPTWAPAVSTRRDGDDFVIELDVPGVQRDWIDITVARQILTITGVRRPPWDTEPGQMQLGTNEREFGPFQRVVVLPDVVPVEQIKASMADGVLVLRYAVTREPGEAQSVPVA